MSMAQDERSVTGTFPDLRGKRVLITGASAGIGKAAAVAFDANGAEVAVMSRSKERLDAVVKTLKKGHAVVGDLTNMDDCTRAAKEAVAAMGGLDVLVNNGAPSTPGMLEKSQEPEGFELAFRLHVSSTFAIIKACEAELIKSKGCVVNVSSIAANHAPGLPMLLPYNVAKSAQDALTRGLARQYAPHGVRVNALLPGWTHTEQTENVANMWQLDIQDFMSQAGDIVGLKRVATAEEQAGTIVFLASKSAGYITGAALPADGGLMLQANTMPPVLLQPPPPPRPANGA